MDYKVFYRKYRPKNFVELIGQDNIKEILVNSIKLNKIAHAYIFTGPRGTGKTSTAKIFAKTLNCINNSNGISCEECEMCKTFSTSADIIEIDAASNNGVEEIRALRDSVKIAPYNSKYKVYIIDEVHMLSNSAWNAFLKTLEEPPAHVIFILATTEINKIPETVMSRCQRFDFSKIPEDLMFIHLSNICKLENITITEDALKEIVKLSNGCLRDALSYLDKISKFDLNITSELIEKNFGILSGSKLDNLYKQIRSSNIEQINIVVNEISSTGITPLNFINDFVNYLMNKIIKKEIYDVKEIDFIKNLINKLNNLITNFNSVINPYILIKLEFITLNYFPGNTIVDISQDNFNLSDKVQEKKSDNFKDNISIIKEEKKVETALEKDSVENIQEKTLLKKINYDKIKSVRINNSFVDASKDLKLQFSEKWVSMLNELSIKSEFNLLGYVENASIEVVSSTNVIFSFKNDNESIIFNDNLEIIENKYNDLNNSKYKFLALSSTEWNDEKANFIKNKNKKYVYINEDKTDYESLSLVQDLAEDVFGKSIIEIK